MPLPQKKLIPGILLMLVIAALAAPPLWWGTGNPPVIDVTATTNNRGPANIGQAKHMAKSALAALRAVLPAVATQIENDLSGGANPILDFTVPTPKTPEWQQKQKAPLLIGQLKAIADPFYTRLHAAAPAWLEAERTTNGTRHPGSIFPWTTETTDDANKAIANIGQLKAVFSLRFETLSPLDADGNGLPDDWQLANAGKFAAYPPLLAAEMSGMQNESKPLILWNDTNSAVNYTVTVGGATYPVYSHADSITGGIAYEWQDISATGVRLATVSDADDASEAAPFTAFAFPFFGQNFSEVSVSSNGLLSFGARDTSYTNQPLPGTSAPPNVIAPFWDDLDTRTSGDIHYKQEAGRFIVQFKDITRLRSSDKLTFQAVLFSDGRIQFRYHTLRGDLGSCTVGIQNLAKDQGIGVIHNAPYLQSGMAVEIRPDSDFLKVDPPGGRVPAHTILPLAARFSSYITHWRQPCIMLP